jgi:hypothetical protein
MTIFLRSFYVPGTFASFGEFKFLPEETVIWNTYGAA